MKHLASLLLLLLSIHAIAQDFEDMFPNFEDPKQVTVKKDSTPYNTVESFTSVKTKKKLNWLIHKQYDNRGNNIQIRYTDTLMNLKDAVVCSAPIVNMKYNERNQCIEKSYFESEGKETMHDCGHFHKELNEYDKMGFVSMLTVYGLNNSFMGKVAFRNDKKGNHIQIRYLQENGQLTTDPSPIIYVEYDNKGRKTKEIFKDKHNQPFVDENVLSYQTYQYKKKYVIVTYFDGKNKVLKKVKRGGGGAVSTEEVMD